MVDRFQDFSKSLNGPASHGFSVTPSDGVDLPEVTRGLYVGGEGTLSVVLQSGAEVQLINLGKASLLPLRVARVKATGTTATGIVGLV
jgi:hypothetical protein